MIDTDHGVDDAVDDTVDIPVVPLFDRLRRPAEPIHAAFQTRNCFRLARHVVRYSRETRDESLAAQRLELARLFRKAGWAWRRKRTSDQKPTTRKG